MHDKLRHGIYSLLPFLLAGIAIAFVIGLFIVFSRLLMWGILIGAILWAFALVSNFFSPKKRDIKPSGRVFEHTDKKQ